MTHLDENLSKKFVGVDIAKVKYDVFLASSYRVKHYAKALGYFAKNDKIDSLVI